MLRWTLLGLLLTLLTGCIELYEFDVKNDSETLVVEGFISDKSYFDTQNYPSEGRFFSVRLSSTSRVTNQHNNVVSGANVRLEDSDGNEYVYTEIPNQPGIYYLFDGSFAAQPNKEYKLKIALSEGQVFESQWEKMVDSTVEPMGDICFDEVDKKVYVWKSGEQEVEAQKGIDICIGLPQNPNTEPLYYRWDFSAMWIYIAPLSSIIDYGHKCWVTNDLYLNDYAVTEDKNGGYRNKLVYMSLYRNERTFEKMSILVTQQAMTEEYYRFWKEMQEQTERGGLFDAQPYNLETNINQVAGGNQRVSGYFGVVKEQAKRWYFSRHDLSYYVEDYLLADCEVYYGPGPKAPECYSCLDYPKGNPTVFEPVWWEK